MKYTITNMEAPNEPISFSQEELGMYFMESDISFHEAIQSLVSSNM